GTDATASTLFSRVLGEHRGAAPLTPSERGRPLGSSTPRFPRGAGVHRPLLPAEEKVLGGRMSEIGIKDLRFGFASSNPRSIAAAGPPAGRCNPFVGRPERRTTDETLPRPSDSLDSADQLCVAGIGRYHHLLARAGHARDDFACACRLRFVRRLVFHS